MANTDQSPVTLASLMEMGGSCLTPLDAAADYWRARADRLLPIYLLAMAPHAVVAMLLIAAIAGERRSLFAPYCLYLTLAMIWRWIWISRLQHGVQEDLRAQSQPLFWSRLPRIMLIRLFAFYGPFLGGFAAPLLLESDEPAWTRVRAAVSWILGSGGRLFRICLAVGLISLVMLVAFFTGEYILANTVLPSLLAIDTADLGITLNSWAWRLSMCYFVFLIIDAYWSVASVIVYYDSQSRRTATDLQARMTVLTEAAG